MKIYLDLSFLNLILLFVGGLYFKDKILATKDSIYKKIGLSFLLSLKLVFIYFPSLISYFLYFIYDIVIFIIFYRKKSFKVIILFYIYTFIISFLIYIALKKEIGFKNLLMVIKEPLGAVALLLDIIFIFVTRISILIVDRLFHLKDFKIDVLLSSSREKRQVKAYYDSGNTMTIEQSPVIFLKKDALNFDIKDEVHPSIPLAMPFRYEGVYRVNVMCGIGKKSYPAYAILVSNKEDLYGCQCLLNVFLRR